MMNSNTPPAKRRRGRPKRHVLTTYYKEIQPHIQQQTSIRLPSLNYSLDQKQEKAQQNVQSQNLNQNSQDINYNINEESQLRCVPYEMLPLSEVEDQQAGRQQRTNNSGQMLQKYYQGYYPQRQDYDSIQNDILVHTPPIQQHHQNSLRKRIPKILQTKVQKQKQINKACRCKKSHCLKNYCECFLNNQACNSSCQCLNCQNVQKQQKVHQIKTDLQKIKQKQEGRCSCKRSNCLKNYCECRLAGKICHEDCHCKDCKNIKQ